MTFRQAITLRTCELRIEVEIAQVVRHIFRGTQRLELREMKQHFRWRFCILRQHKINLYAVNSTSVVVQLYFVRRCKPTVAS